MRHIFRLQMHEFVHNDALVFNIDAAFFLAHPHFIPIFSLKCAFKELLPDIIVVMNYVEDLSALLIISKAALRVRREDTDVAQLQSSLQAVLNLLESVSPYPCFRTFF